MTTLAFKVTKNWLERTDKNRLVANNVEQYRCEFQFDDSWKTVTTLRYVFVNGGVNKEIVQAKGFLFEPITLPFEVLVEGLVYVSIIGLDEATGGQIVTERMARPMQVNPSGELEGESPEAFTPSIKEQILAAVADDVASAANSAKRSADSAAESRVFADSAEDAAQRTETAAEVAKASETAAEKSENNAAESAKSASASETAAKGSADRAKTSAAEAATSRDNAAASETAAEKSAGAAESSAALAASAANGAVDSANMASASMRAAATSETNAKNSETAAATSATAAATSVSAAAVSASNAAASEAAAKAAQKAAEDARDAAGEIVGGDFASKAEAQGYADKAEEDANKYTDQKIAAIPTPDVSGQIQTHNAATDAHADIREAMPKIYLKNW